MGQSSCSLPAPRKVLLHVEVDNFEADDVVFGETMLVLGSRVAHNTRGFDLATGQVRWTVPDPGRRDRAQPADGELGRIEARRTAHQPADRQLPRRQGVCAAHHRWRSDPARSRHRAGSPPGEGGEHRRLRLRARRHDRGRWRALRRDPRHGGEADPGNGPGETRIAERVLHTAEPGTTIAALTACRAARICFTENGQGDGEVAHNIIALDTTTGKVLWKQDGVTRDLRVVGDRVLATILVGRVTRRARSSTRPAASSSTRGARRASPWLDPEAALIFRPSRDGTSTEVLGLSPLTSQPTSLGTLTGGRGCGWTTTNLICVTPDGIKVWRFTQ